MSVNNPTLQVLVGGQWLRARGKWGDLTYGTIWPGGTDQITFSMAAKYASRISNLVRNTDVQVCIGGWPLVRGYILEPAWSGATVQVTCNGSYRQAENYPAFDSAAAMNGITNPTTAITTANSLGLGWTLDPAGTVPNTDLPTGTNTDPLNYLNQLLDAWAAYLGQKWWVDQFNVIRFTADPTVPTLVIPNGAGDLGIASDDYASNAVLRYNDSGTGTYKSAPYPALTGAMDNYGNTYGRKIYIRDISSDWGPISAATAATLAQNVYTGAKQRPGWTNDLPLGYGQIFNTGRQRVHPMLVNAYCAMASLQGVRDEVALTSYTNFVVGKTSYSQPAGQTSGQLVVSPVGLAARSDDDVYDLLLSAAQAAGTVDS